MTLSAEVGHVYTAELEKADGVHDWVARARREASLVAAADVWLLFVDDYPDAYSKRQRKHVAQTLLDAASRKGLKFDAVCFESDCGQVAGVLADALPHYDGWIEREGRNYRRAVRIKKEEPGLWECPALAAIWTLARLGCEPYREAVLAGAHRVTDRFDADDVLTVLPVSYIDNEANVVDIIRQLRTPRVPLRRVQYVLA